jgi:hypothetical protein
MKPGLPFITLLLSALAPATVGCATCTHDAFTGTPAQDGGGGGGGGAADDGGDASSAAHPGGGENPGSSDGGGAADGGPSAGETGTTAGDAGNIAPGIDAGPCSAHVPGDYATVSSAVAAFSSTGGVICLGPQAFHETVDVYHPGPVRIAIVGASQSQTSVDAFRLESTGAATTLALAQLSVPQGIIANTGTNETQTGNFEATQVTFGPVRIESTKITLVDSVVTGGLAAMWTLDVLIDRCDLSGGSPVADIFSSNGTALVVQNSYIHDPVATTVNGLDVRGYDRVQVVNDTFQRTGTGLVFEGSGNVPLQAYNNLFLDNGTAINVAPPAGSSTTQADYNGYFGNTSRFSGSIVPGAHDVTGDAMIDGASPPALRAGSPDRAAGITSSPAGAWYPLAIPAYDFHGAARTSIDIGAVN